MHILEAVEKMKKLGALESSPSVEGEKTLIRFAVNLRAKLVESKLHKDQKALAKASDVSGACICRILQGESNPRLVTIASLCVALDCAVEELFQPIRLDIKL
jgi:DNA-binding XRE family transcriptional regulator